MRGPAEATWRKSSYSNTQGDNCVEVAWRKSSYSGGQGDNCVEVGPAASTVSVRDTKNRPAGMITVSADTWARFIDGLTDHAS